MIGALAVIGLVAAGAQTRRCDHPRARRRRARPSRSSRRRGLGSRRDEAISTRPRPPGRGRPTARAVALAALALWLFARCRRRWAPKRLPPRADPDAVRPGTTPPAAPPAAGRVKLVLQKVGGSPPFALLGGRIVVRGIVAPYVAGQTVKVSFYREGRKVEVRSVERARRALRQRRGSVPHQLREPLPGTRGSAGGPLRDGPAGGLQRSLTGRALRQPERRAGRSGPIGAPAAVGARRSPLRGAVERQSSTKQPAGR